MPEMETCITCGETSEYNGDWYNGECPPCADASEPQYDTLEERDADRADRAAEEENR